MDGQEAVMEPDDQEDDVAEDGTPRTGHNPGLLGK